jgi:periplasmic protein TonB
MPNVNASAAYAAEPEAPQVATGMHLTGTTYVQVDLDSSGAVLDARVAKSAGTPILDRAALAAARASVFRPEIRDCVPTSGSYLFLVEFP